MKIIDFFTVFRAQDGPKLAQVGGKMDQVCSQLARSWLKLTQVDSKLTPSWLKHVPGSAEGRSSSPKFGQVGTNLAPRCAKWVSRLQKVRSSWP